MPIRPENRALYPGGSPTSREWRAIRDRILRRSEVQLDDFDDFVVPMCECTGECGVDHASEWCQYSDGLEGILVRMPDTLPKRCQAVHLSLHPVTESKVILTIAHLDHDPRNSADKNLKAMCQRCHNRYDAPTRRRNAIRRRCERLERGIPDLPLFR